MAEKKRAKKAAGHNESALLVGRKGRGRSKTSSNSLLLPSPGERSVYRAAYDRWKLDGRTEHVAALLQRGDQQGDGRASYALATWYIHGVVFDVDGKKAVRLLKKACKAGIHQAMYDLAICYEKGFGVSKSQTKAANLYVESALRGDLDAREEVIRCVYWGLGVERNRKLAQLIGKLFDSTHQQRPVTSAKQ